VIKFHKTNNKKYISKMIFGSKKIQNDKILNLVSGIF